MKRTTVVSVVAVLTLAGCGGGSHQSSPTIQRTAPNKTATAPTSTQQVGHRARSQAALRAAVRAALLANHRLAIRVLWTNHVPANAWQSTRGPALAETAASAMDRLKKGIRVRMIQDEYRILSIRIAAMKAAATAVAKWDQRVVPSHANGASLGGAVSLHERARIDLRRVGSTQRFVVWKVRLIR